MKATFLRSKLILTVLVPLSFALVAMSSCADSEDSTNGANADPALSGEMINNPKSAESKPDAVLDQATVPVMTFERDKWDFGAIIQGEIVEYSFKFTNTGKTPLVITSAKGSCGCTVPEWPKEPIPAGESGFLKVTYDSNGRRDKFDKTVTITANTVPNTNLLYISGNVIVPEE
ncbi:MAG: DUF1573 domain-containing protein [Bacteroidetes bacterium]|nr:DUF1573 domain-containing protein [Bacteroidota bacterium]